MPSINYSTHSNNEATASSGFSYSHTINSGNNRILLACVTLGTNASRTLNSITIGGVSMTSMYEVSFTAPGWQSWLYGLLDADLPSTGSQTFSISLSGTGSLCVTLIQYDNVLQTLTERSSSHEIDTATGTHTVTLAGVQSSDMTTIFSQWFANTTAPSLSFSGGGQTQLHSTLNGASNRHGAGYETGEGTPEITTSGGGSSPSGVTVAVALQGLPFTARAIVI